MKTAGRGGGRAVERRADKLRLTVTGGGSLQAGGGSVQAAMAAGVHLQLGDVSADNQVLAVVSLERLPPLFGREVSGILGNTFIKDYVVQIDYAERVLTFLRPEQVSLANDSHALPLENRGGIPYVQLQLALDDEAPIVAMFEIDTGSSTALNLNRPFAEEHRILARVPAGMQREGAGGSGVGGD